MKKNIDIENLFKERFENFSAKPDANLFDKIQQQVNANPASSVSQVAAKTASFTTKAKIAVIGVSSLIVGATVGYIVSNNSNTKNSISTISEKSNVLENNNSQNQFTEKSPILANKKDEIKDKVIETKSVSKERVNEYLGEQSSNSTIISDEKSNSANTNVNDNTTEIEKMPKTNNNVKDISNSSTQNTIVIPETTSQDNSKKNEKENSVLRLNPEANPKEGYAPVEIEFFAQSNADHYYWDFGDDKVSEKANPIHSYDTPGIYTVTLEVEKDDVFEIKTFEIKVHEKSNIVKLPSIMTPNNDGNNDYFFIPTKGIDKMEIAIYNNQNKVVYRSTNVDFKWDGNDFYGNPLTGDFTYIFTAVGKDGNIFKKTSGLKIVRR